MPDPDPQHPPEPDPSGEPANLTPSPLNGVVPPIEHRFKPGQSGNPRGRPAAGAAIKEWINVLADPDSGLTRRDIRKIATSDEEPWPKQMAAQQILMGSEFADIADFEDILSGQRTLSEARKSGTDTAIIKKCKSKSRKVKVADGEFEEVVEREIELYDRAGASVDRICDRTDGRPVQSVNVDANVTAEAELTVSPADVEAVLAALAHTKESEGQ